MLESIIVLIFKKCPYFGLRPYFVLFGLHKPSFALFVLPYFLSYRQSIIVTS